MLTYHIGADGMKVYRDGKLLAHIHPDHYPHLVAKMARHISDRWDGTGRQNNADAAVDTGSEKG